MELLKRLPIKVIIVNNFMTRHFLMSSFLLIFVYQINQNTLFMYSANYKMPTKLIEIKAFPGTIEIYDNTRYTWAGQRGFFVQEDDNIFAWTPGNEGQGTPSYFNQETIQHLCDNHGVPTILH